MTYFNLYLNLKVWPATRANFSLLWRAFYAVLVHFRPFLCTVVTLTTLSSNLCSFDKNEEKRKEKKEKNYPNYFRKIKSIHKKSKTNPEFKNLKYQAKTKKKKKI